MLRNQVLFFVPNTVTKIQTFKTNNAVALYVPCLPSPLHPPAQCKEHLCLGGWENILCSFCLQFRGFHDKIKCRLWQKHVWQSNDKKWLNYSW